jgi:predicted AAA+ superfamily ATPase
MTELNPYLDRIEKLLNRLENLLPNPLPADFAWEDSIAFRWRKQLQRGYLQPVRHPHRLRLEDLRQIDQQKVELARNTEQFLTDKPYNHVLLWGARGTGKSSLIKALLNEYAQRGLRLIEVDKHDLMDLPDIVEPLYERPEKFLLFCDDLSFEANDPSYKALKAVLDGSVSAAPENVMLCVTSNRRHLLPETMADNQGAIIVDGELHQSEAVEEKISLSERFGLWLSFYPFSQDDYLVIVQYWLEQLNQRGAWNDTVRRKALQWALHRGSRSGRVAWQFARDWVGRQDL